ncbi:MAG: hypothetical protein HY822_24615, partial [Acidobacteria bacterium]|nr:hypothetical protein [Acidobacteriota bacterium]
MRLQTVLAFVVCAAGACAQMAPVVTPRGVVNAFSQLPAPSVVAPGGLLWITGLNLGPPAGAKATGTPWPTQLGDPPVEAFIQSLSERQPRPMPLYSASPDKIVAQVPIETSVGLASVYVRRGEARSRPASVSINRLEPSLRTVDDKGYGEAAAAAAGSALVLSASGLGDTELKQPVRVYVGGLPASSNTSYTADRTVEFDIQLEVPAGALPGDVVSVVVNNRAANRA